MIRLGNRRAVHEADTGHAAAGESTAVIAYTTEEPVITQRGPGRSGGVMASVGTGSGNGKRIRVIGDLPVWIMTAVAAKLISGILDACAGSGSLSERVIDSNAEVGCDGVVAVLSGACDAAAIICQGVDGDPVEVAARGIGAGRARRAVAQGPVDPDMAGQTG